MPIDKDFLTAHGVAEENVAVIIAEHDKVLSAEKNATILEKQRADTAETKLGEANTKLQGYDPEWKTKAETEKQNAQKEIDKMKFDFAVEAALKESGARNGKSVKALLNMDGLKLNGNEVVGLKEQIESIQKDNGFLFEEKEPEVPPRFTLPPSHEPMSQGQKTTEAANAALRAAFGHASAEK